MQSTTNKHSTQKNLPANKTKLEYLTKIQVQDACTRSFKSKFYDKILFLSFYSDICLTDKDFPLLVKSRIVIIIFFPLKTRLVKTYASIQPIYPNHKHIKTRGKKAVFPESIHFLHQ